MHSSICENLFGVLVLPRSMVELEEGDGVMSIMGICAFCYI